MKATWPTPNVQPQGQWLGSAGWNTDLRRVASVQIARSFVGLGKSDPCYLEALYPCDTKQMQVQMASHQSMCALVCAAIMRCLGIDHPTLWEPYAEQYKTLDAVSRLRVIAGAHKALSGRDTVPIPGEQLIIGQGIKTHALTVIAWDGLFCMSIDGGMGKVRLVERGIVHSGGQLFLHDQVMGNRRVENCVHVGDILPVNEWALPAK